MAGTSSHAANKGVFRSPENGSRSAVECGLVLIVSMELAGAVPGMTEAGENAQLAPVGSPAEQDRVTALLKLFIPVATIW
jgi:hypothetical protein